MVAVSSSAACTGTSLRSGEPDQPDLVLQFAVSAQVGWCLCDHGLGVGEAR